MGLPGGCARRALALLPLLALSSAAFAGLYVDPPDSSPDALAALNASLPRASFPSAWRPGDVRLAFGSCNKHWKPQPAWAQIAARKPDLFAWLGDAVYADTPIFLKLRLPATAARVAGHLAAPLQVPAYRQFLATVPTVGVWDDHDAGAWQGGGG